MESSSSGEPPPPGENRCACSCTFCCHSSEVTTTTWHRSVKRKADSVDPDAAAASSSGVARVDSEIETAALRETVARQLETIQELSAELDEERSAAASAANEAMAMILKLQREKAEAQMEARQFKRFAEEKMAHDNGELVALEDLLMRREEMLQTLSAKLYAYRMRFDKLGFSESDLERDSDEMEFLGQFEYPPLKCGDQDQDQEQIQVSVGKEEVVEMYEFGDNPAEDLSEIENRIHNLEKEEKEEEEEENSESGKEEEQVKVEEDDDEDDEYVEDDTSDRVYTIDTVHGTTSPPPLVKVSEESDVDIKRLYMRLEALEADRESMRQALVAMRTEKAQLILLQEIAQQLSKEVVVVHERKTAKKKSFVEAFSIITLFKWLLSHVWNKKASRIRYTFGLSARNLGLLVILDKTPQMSHLRRHLKVHVSLK